jgi:hypothetical protein
VGVTTIDHEFAFPGLLVCCLSAPYLVGAEQSRGRAGTPRPAPIQDRGQGAHQRRGGHRDGDRRVQHPPAHRVAPPHPRAQWGGARAQDRQHLGDPLAPGGDQLRDPPGRPGTQTRDQEVAGIPLNANQLIENVSVDFSSISVVIFCKKKNAFFPHFSQNDFCFPFLLAKANK